jgi:hypothetical protein
MQQATKALGARGLEGLGAVGAPDYEQLEVARCLGPR